MKPNRITISILLLLVWTGNVRGQDLQFSQFFDAPLLRNPALAGLFEGDVRVQAVFRTQWSSVTNAYKTGSLNAEYKIPVGNNNDYATFGLQTYYDRAGTVAYTNIQLLPAINYHKSLSDVRNMYLSAGFMGGLVQHRIDLSRVTTNSTYEGMGINETITDPSYSYLDGSAGLSFNTSIGNDPHSNFFLGVAYHHFNRPSASFYRNKAIQLHPKWVFSGGLKLSAGESSFVHLEADHWQQGSFRQSIFGGLFGLKIGPYPDEPDYTVALGTFMRLDDALIPVVQLAHGPYSLSVSYDANISRLKPSSNGRGGFELSLRYAGAVNRYSNPYAPRF